MSSPLVSVLMPCYNHEKYVAIAIQSVLVQTYKNIELIIIDDGSTDRTWTEIENFKDLPNVIVFRQDNKGLIETLKELREKANGIFLTILASDDKFYPTKIEVMVDAFRSHPAAALCLGRTDIIDSRGAICGLVKGEFNGKGSLYHKLLNGKTYVSSVSTMVRADTYNQVEFFDSYIEDLPAWLQISREWPTIVVNKVVASYRHVNGSMSSKSERMIHSEMRILEKYITGGQRSPFPPGWCGRWFNSYTKVNSKMAINFLLSKRCSTKIIFTLDFYKGVIKLIYSVPKKL